MLSNGAVVLEIKTNPFIVNRLPVLLGVACNEGQVKQFPCTPNIGKLIENKLNDHQTWCPEPTLDVGWDVVRIDQHPLRKHRLIIVEKPL